MTYAELVEKVAELVPDEHFMVRVETWRNVSNGLLTPPRTTWGITTFCGESIAHRAHGNTAEGALAFLRDKMNETPLMPVVDMPEIAS